MIWIYGFLLYGFVLSTVLSFMCRHTFEKIYTRLKKLEDSVKKIESNDEH
jgi:hypothetical protein